jgi:hypothetical protein
VALKVTNQITWTEAFSPRKYFTALTKHWQRYIEVVCGNNGKGNSLINHYWILTESQINTKLNMTMCVTFIQNKWAYLQNEVEQIRFESKQ